MKSFIFFSLPIVFASILSSVAAGQTPTSSSPNIVVDSALVRAEHQTTVQQVQQLEKKAGSLECSPNHAPKGGIRTFKSPVSVGDSLGGRVKTIRVVRFAALGERHSFSQLPEDIRRVWNGKFQSSSCYMNWAEGALWFVEARLEFADGKQGLLMTDGGHVALQDHDGMTWYLRLLPAAQ